MVTRRRLLAASGGLLGITGAGGGYVAWSLRGGELQDVDVDRSTVPVVTTRGAFDEAGQRRHAPIARRDGEWALGDADELFLFVHGLDTDDERARTQTHLTQLGLTETPLAAPVVGYSWDGDRDWDVAKRIAEANGPVLADWLVDWADEDGRPIHVLGYSLGARVTCEALQTLVASGESDVLASISLLGGAIPHDSVERGDRYGDVIETATPTVHNFHSRNDRILGWGYRFLERTRAVGYSGIRDPDAAPNTYLDVDVTDDVADHAAYFQPGEGCLPRVVAAIS